MMVVDIGGIECVVMPRAEYDLIMTAVVLGVQEGVRELYAEPAPAPKAEVQPARGRYEEVVGEDGEITVLV